MSARITVGQRKADMIKNMRKYIVISYFSRSRFPLSIGMGTPREEIHGPAFPLSGHRKRHRGVEFRPPCGPAGIGRVWRGEDSLEAHIEDAPRAGAGLCHAEVVDMVVRDAPSKIRELIEWGVRFTRRDGGQGDDIGREGGHSKRRIFHAKDLTGREVGRALLSRARADRRIRIYENHTAVNLITRRKLESLDRREEDETIGAYVLDMKTGAIHTFLADATILSTGGVRRSQTWNSYSPPPPASIILTPSPSSFRKRSAARGRNCSTGRANGS